MISLLAGLSPDGPRPPLPPLPRRSTVFDGRVSIAHQRHPIGTTWPDGLTVEGYTWSKSRPSLRCRCACGWRGDVAVRLVDHALDDGRAPRCHGRAHLGPCEPVAPEAPPKALPRGRPRRDQGPAYARILAAYDKLLPTWTGTKKTLHLAVVREAGFPTPPGYTGAAVFVGEALRARREGRA